MKKSKDLVRELIILSILGIIISCSSKSTKKGSTDEPKNEVQVAEVKNVEPIDIKFNAAFYPFPENVVSYNVSSDFKTMTINGTSTGSFGLSCERVINLNGNNTLEIEVVNLGKSKFHEGELSKGAGNGRMLKVFICLDKGDFALKCNDGLSQSGDPEFTVCSPGKYEYTLGTIDKIYKLGFSFYNASLDGFIIKTRLIKK